MGWQLCTFRLGTLDLAVDAQRALEVLRARAVTPVPLAPPGTAGLVNLRGDIVTALDLRERLGAGGGGGDRHLVVATPEGPVALVVDDVGDVVDADPAALQPPPPTVAAGLRPLLTGAYPAAGALLLVIEPRHLLQPELHPS